MERKIFTKRTRRADREESRNRILVCLSRARLEDGIGKVRYSQLEKESNLSPKSLSETLDELQKDKLIDRIVDTSSQSYPVPVYYRLTAKAGRDEAVKQTVFTEKVKKQIDARFNDILGKPMATFLVRLTNTMNAIVLYEMSERLRLGQPWTEHAEDVNMILGHVFWLLKKNVVYLKLGDKPTLEELRGAMNEIEESPGSFKGIGELRATLKKLYREEIETFYNRE